MKIGIVGGTFDPIHNGHLYLAGEVAKRLNLSKVIFVPAYLPPHKTDIKISPSEDRYAMVKLALRGHKRFIVSDIEIKRKGKSYSVITLRQFRKIYGSDTELFFITGSDAVDELDKWKSLKEILRLCKFVIVKRPGFKIKNLPQPFILMDINAKDISGTEIRKRIKLGKSVSRYLPDSVRRYIFTHDLYTK